VLVNPAWVNPGQSHQFHAQDEFGQFSFGYAGGPSARTESRDVYGVTQGSYQYVDANGLLQTVNYIADPINGFRVAGTNIPTAVVAPEVAALVGPAPVEETPEVRAAKAEFQAAFDAAVAATADAVAADAAAPAEVEEPVVAERKRRDAQVVYNGLPYPYAAAAGVYAAAPAQIVANIAPATAVISAAAPTLAYAGAPALAYAGVPALAYAGAPALTYAAETVSAPAAREATLTTVQLNPGHAVSYRVD